MSKLLSVLNVELCSSANGFDYITRVNAGSKSLIVSILTHSKLGRIPMFLNGVSVSGKASLIGALLGSNHKEFKLQWCLDSDKGHEVCCNVQSFKTYAEFDRSPYFRRGTHLSTNFDLLTK